MKKLLLLLLLAGLADATYYTTPITNTNDLVGWWHLDNDTALGESNSWVYDSSNHHRGNGTFSFSYTTDAGYYGKALYTPEDNVGIGGVKLTNASTYKSPQFTFTAWIKREVTLTDWIFSNYNNTGNDNGVYLFADTDNRLGFRGYNTTGAICADSFGTIGSLPLGTWVFVAVSVNNTQAKLYVNGVYDVASTSGNISQIVYGPINAYIGSSGYSPTATFNGTIDEVMYWNRSLTDAEIRSQYLSDLEYFTYPPINQSRTPYMREAAAGRPLQAVRNVFTDLMGGLFYALILGVLWVAAWLRLRNYVFPTVMLDILLFAYFWDLMPAEVQTAIYAINALVFGSVLLRLMTPVYSE